MVDEVTYGTAVVVTRFLEMQEESVKNDVAYIFSRGTKDVVTRSSRYRAYSKGCGGSIKFEMMNKGFGLLLKHCFGTGASAQVGVTTEYTQTFTPDISTGKTGRFATMQFGRPSVDGTVQPFTYKGCKVTEFEFSSELDGPLMLDVTIDAQSETTGTALASASYPSDPASFIFIDGSLTIDAVAASVKAAKIKGKWSLDTDRRFLGAITTKKEPIANGELEITGELTLEFESLTEYAKFTGGTLSALVLTWSFGTITGASNPYKVVMTLPKVVYTGETPTVKSSEVLLLTLPFKALYDGSNAAWTVAVSTSDNAL
jgi:hypothetical protein